MLFQAAEVEEAFGLPVSWPGPHQSQDSTQQEVQEPEREPTSTDDGGNARAIAVYFPSSFRKACLTS